MADNIGQSIEFERRQNSKLFRTFEWLYALVIINVLTCLGVFLVLPLFPAYLACYASIKEVIANGASKPFKTYWNNFKKYSEVAFLRGILLLLILGSAALGIWFYYQRLDAGLLNVIGFWVLVIGVFVVALFFCHIPLIIITFPKLRLGEILALSIFMTFRYFPSTLVLLSMLGVTLVGTYFFPIWLLVGISLPIYIGIALTRPTYKKLEQIDTNKFFEDTDDES